MEVQQYQPSLQDQLRHVVECGGKERVRDVINRGADVNYCPPGERPLLEIAIYRLYPDHDITRILLDAGYDVNTVNSEGENALFAASHQGDTEAVSILLEYKIDTSTLPLDSLLWI